MSRKCPQENIYCSCKHIPYVEYPEPETLVEYIIRKRFYFGIIVGLFLYQPLFYFLFGVKLLIKMIIWEMGVK